jgi:hypothetical protein
VCVCVCVRERERERERERGRERGSNLAGLLETTDDMYGKHSLVRAPHIPDDLLPLQPKHNRLAHSR